MSAPQKKPERPQVKKNGKNKCISRESNAGPIEPAVGMFPTEDGNDVFYH